VFTYTIVWFWSDKYNSSFYLFIFIHIFAASRLDYSNTFIASCPKNSLKNLHLANHNIFTTCLILSRFSTLGKRALTHKDVHKEHLRVSWNVWCWDISSRVPLLPVEEGVTNLQKCLGRWHVSEFLNRILNFDKMGSATHFTCWWSQFCMI